MKLNEWLERFPPGGQRRAERERIAQALDCSEITVRSWANEHRSVPARQLVPLWEATDGHVMPADMRPDLDALADFYQRKGRRHERALA